MTLIPRRRFVTGTAMALPAVAWGLRSSSSAASNAGETIAWTNAKILTACSAPIERGTLLVQGSTVLAVGASDAVAVPPDAKIIDATGKWMMPGLVCTHSHIGGVGGADGSAPIQPGVRILDSINVRSAGFKRALAGGLTTLNIMPGSGHLISGQTVYCKLRFTDPAPTTIEDIIIRDA
ncbi:MAG: hypothetical protein MUF23_09190, partial [Pirellula sp.]|nr:hypothetical protein [Pirellula sp.]